MWRLLANENFPRTSVLVLRESGCDVLYVAESMASVRDEAVLECSRTEQRILLTFDRDYGDLLFRRRLASPPAVILLRVPMRDPARPAALVLELLMQPPGVTGQFVTVGERSLCRRPLP